MPCECMRLVLLGACRERRVNVMDLAIVISTATGLGVVLMAISIGGCFISFVDLGFLIIVIGARTPRRLFALLSARSFLR